MTNPNTGAGRPIQPRPPASSPSPAPGLPEPEQFNPAMMVAPQASHTIKGAVRFVVPSSARVKPSDPAQLAFRELSADEQVQISNAAGGTTASAMAATRRALVGFSNSYDDVGAKAPWSTLDHGEGEELRAWGLWSSKVRMLCMQAYADVHNSSPDEDKAFLASRTSG